MVTIVTALRGNNSLTKRWANSVFATTLVGDEAKLLVSVNNDIDSDIVSSLFPLAKIVKVEPFRGGGQEERDSYISDVLNSLLRMVDTDELLMWDDDILPNSTLHPYRLIKDLQGQPSTTAGVVSVHPMSIQAETSTIVYKPYGVNAKLKSLPEDGLHKVWSGGTALSCWRTKDFLELLPLKPLITRGTVYGWDRSIAIKLSEKELDTILDASIRSRHDQLT